MIRIKDNFWLFDAKQIEFYFQFSFSLQFPGEYGTLGWKWKYHINGKILNIFFIVNQMSRIDFVENSINWNCIELETALFLSPCLNTTKSSRKSYHCSVQFHLYWLKSFWMVQTLFNDKSIFQTADKPTAIQTWLCPRRPFILIRCSSVIYSAIYTHIYRLSGINFIYGAIPYGNRMTIKKTVFYFSILGRAGWRQDGKCQTEAGNIKYKMIFHIFCAYMKFSHSFCCSPRNAIDNWRTFWNFNLVFCM